MPSGPREGERGATKTTAWLTGPTGRSAHCIHRGWIDGWIDKTGPIPPLFARHPPPDDTRRQRAPPAMDLDSIPEDSLARHLAARAPWLPGPPETSASCPGCGAPLRLSSVGTTDPDRLLGFCTTLRCGEVVTFRRLEGRLIVADRRRADRRRP
jgi:hypothetical protein